MDGIIVLNKPTGISSHDCVNIIRRTFNTKKVGHAGTLDKEASGVLVLGINKGTKLMPYINQDDKGYMFTVAFNHATDTLDHAGELLEKRDFDAFDTLDATLASFLGHYEQTPPAYSAIKVAGKKLYEYARKGEDVPEVEPRPLFIYTLKRLSEIKKRPDGTVEADLFVEASKGLYVRKLALDIAHRLGTVAHTRRIHRTQSGLFGIEDATEMAELKRGKYKVFSLSEAVRGIPALTVDASTAGMVENGRKLDLQSEEERLKLIDSSNTLLAIYVRREDGTYKPEKVFIQRGRS